MQADYLSILIRQDDVRKQVTHHRADRREVRVQGHPSCCVTPNLSLGYESNDFLAPIR